MINRGIAPLTRFGRGSRYVDTSGFSVSMSSAEPILVSFSWEIEYKESNSIISLNAGRPSEDFVYPGSTSEGTLRLEDLLNSRTQKGMPVGLQLDWMIRYVIKQKTMKVFTSLGTNFDLDGQVDGFDSTVIKSANNTSTQSQVYPDPNEMAVFDFPDGLPASMYVNRTSGWQMRQFKIVYQPDIAVYQASADLYNYTPWLPLREPKGLVSTRLPFPNLNNIEEKASVEGVAEE